MNILITGGSGFIGQYLISSLLKKSAVQKIVNLDLKPSDIQHDRLQTLICDINQSNQLLNLTLDEQTYDYCIHLAALCKEPGFEWEEYFETNLYGTENVIALCEKFHVKQIFFTSTMMVFKAGEIRNSEKNMTCPDTAYGISKLLAEKSLERWDSKETGHVLKIIRPAVVFGYNENGNFTRLLNTLKRGFFVFVGRKSTVKANVYVKELVTFIEYLLDNTTTHSIYNFSFPNEYSIGEIVQSFKNTFQMKAFTPILPFTLLRFISYIFEFLNAIGLKNPIHHRRIEKLYISTNISPENALADKYKFKFDLMTALKDWKSDLENK